MNNPSQRELWENIRKFSLDDPSSDLPFSKKLQKENNWSSSFTANAIEEYKKFIFLCCILPAGASPSDIVDTVWHLHLTYTTNYWIEFCQKTLHKDIHHFPSKGGSKEQSKHSNWYQQTLLQYKEIFGTLPPASIWPEIPRFEKQIGDEIYDKKFFKNMLLGFGILTVLLVMVFNPFRLNGEDFLVYYFIMLVAGILASWILQQHKSKKLQEIMEHHFPIKFSPYQVASFLYGSHRAYQTALVDLLKRDIIDVSGAGYKLTNTRFYDPAKEENPLLPALTDNITIGNTFTYREGITFMDGEKLQHTSFDQLTSLSKKIDYQKFIVPGIILAIGFTRLFQGMANEKPVGFLVLEIGLFSLIALMIAARYSYTSLVFKSAKSIWMTRNDNGHSSDILNNFTLLGAAAIAGFAEYHILSTTFQSETPYRRSQDGGLAGTYTSCSGGDSGGDSGGGGCGGCGGGD